jgi:hypothetical protein
MNDDESAAMWKLYSGDHGIAIKSDVGSLKEAFRPDDRDVVIRAVDYVGDVGDAAPGRYFGFQKRRSFAHERELRAMVSIGTSDSVSETGIQVKVRLAKLVGAVFIAPTAPHWMKKVVEREVLIHGLKAPVYLSSLYDPV